jgi:hypothetical protein
MKTKIYALRENSFVRYVGKTCRTLEQRLADHLNDARKGAKTYKACWICSMLNKGSIPSITLLEKVNGDGSKEERYWIKYFQGHGIKLTNGTEGGTGGNVWAFSSKKEREVFSKKMSSIMKSRIVLEDVRKRTSQTLKGHSVSEETKRKISQANKGRKLPLTTRERMRNKIVSDETRRKRSFALMGHKGVVHTEEFKKRMSLLRKGVPLVEGVKRKISLGNKGKVRTQEMRKRYSEAKKGVQYSLEARKKMSLAKKGKPWTEARRQALIKVKTIPDASAGKLIA